MAQAAIKAALEQERKDGTVQVELEKLGVANPIEKDDSKDKGKPEALEEFEDE